jgi:hypothetical protein
VMLDSSIQRDLLRCFREQFRFLKSIQKASEYKCLRENMKTAVAVVAAAEVATIAVLEK